MSPTTSRAAVVLAAWMTWSGSAGADAPPSEGPAAASELPPGPLKRAILDINKRLASDKRSPELVAEPLGEAIRAGRRAQGARAAGDARHGAMLDKLGAGWVTVAEVILRAAAAEARAQVEAKRLRELTTNVERAEALLVEQQARLGRLRSEVEERERQARARADKTLAKEADRVEHAATKKTAGKDAGKGGGKGTER